MKLKCNLLKLFYLVLLSRLADILDIFQFSVQLIICDYPCGRGTLNRGSIPLYPRPIVPLVHVFLTMVAIMDEYDVKYNNYGAFMLKCKVNTFYSQQHKSRTAYCIKCHKRKRRWSDPVLWQNPLYQQKIRKPKDNTQTPPKTSITQRLRTDLGRSVGVTSHPTGVVKPVYGYPTFPLTATAV